MLKFIRRLIILLVLFFVIFVIYRSINPDGASRFVDKVKTIPDNISSMLGLDKEDNIKINGETISISGDVDIIDNNENDLVDDMSWLESLNKEIEDILGQDKTGVVIDESFLEDSSSEKKEDTNTGVIFVSGSITNTGVLTTIVTGNTITTSTTITTTNAKKPTNKLSDSDYQQIKDIFGNLVSP